MAGDPHRAPHLLQHAGDSAAAPVPWAPSTVYRTPAGPNARGLLDRRGLVHAHSVHSHDACDGQPRDDAGVYDAVCNADFRRGLCQVQHDFVFLTDHRGSFDETEFPDTLLYDATLGDVLVTHGGLSTASWLSCPDAGPALVMAGAETNTMMPIGIEEHVGPAATRGSVYGDDQPASYLQVKQKNAVMLVAHTEGWTAPTAWSTPAPSPASRFRSTAKSSTGCRTRISSSPRTPGSKTRGTSRPGSAGDAGPAGRVPGGDPDHSAAPHRPHRQAARLHQERAALGVRQPGVRGALKPGSRRAEMFSAAGERAGSLVAVSFTFAFVRAVGGKPLGEITFGPARRILARLEERPVRTIALLRTVLLLAPPLNYALALAPIKQRDHLLGSALGLVVPVAGVVFLSECVAALVRGVQ